MAVANRIDLTPINSARTAASLRYVGDWLVEKLSRVTTSGEVIREIDGFRFLAIASVVVFHVLAIYLEATHRLGVTNAIRWPALKQTSHIAWILQSGRFGVELFFVISGFVLALPFARHHLSAKPAPSLKSYYLRRLTRIEPPYVISLLIYMLAIYFTRCCWESYLPNFFASGTYSHNLIYGEQSRIESIFWSLEIEVQFYLVAPLLAWLFAIKTAWLRRGLLVGVIIVSGILGVYWVGFYPVRLARSLLSYLHYFLAGFLLVEIYLAKLMHRPRQSYGWDGIALLTPMVIFLIIDSYWKLFWLLPFAVLLLYVSLFLGRIGNRLITLKPVYIIGGLCYTLYLYHVLVIKQVGRLTFSLSSPRLPLALDLLIQGILLIPLMLVICSVLFYLTERPFMENWFHLSR